MSADVALRPVLARYPDARAGKLPLLEPILLPYLGLMFGSFVASVAGAYNALVLRRVGLAIRSLLIGALGWIAFLFVVAFVAKASSNGGVGLIAGRLLHFAIGGALYTLQRPHVRGHTFLGGRTAPMLACYLASIVLAMILPWSVVRFLLGDWVGR